MVGLTYNNDSDRSSWFAVRTLSRHEKLVRDQLASRNIEHFSLRQSDSTNGRIEKRRWRFHFSPDIALQDCRWEDRLMVLQSQGVVCFVGSAARAEPIPDEEIDSLRKVAK